MRTGIAPSVWGEEGHRAIATAAEMLQRVDEADSGDDEDDSPGPGGPQMSG